MKEKLLSMITENKKLASGIFSMKIQAQGLTVKARPGQFVILYCKDESRKLGRPLSICEIDHDKQELRIVYRVVGKGTEEFSKLNVGDQIPVLGPLGNGYDIHAKHVLLVAGGVGIPPMLELAKSISGEKTIVLGYRNNELFLKEDFERYGTVYIATDDGSAGIKGNVVDVIQYYGIETDIICACGPTPMLRALANYTDEQDIEAKFSMEAHMACGIGVCLGCAIPIKDEQGFVYKRVCKDGPVFDSKEIMFDEM
ncbi:dihydroorotate dehydrogenase electron transfer subunit [Eubacterium ramulus]